MIEAKEYFHQLIQQIPNAILGKMFGAEAIKMPNGKAGAFFKNNLIIVKIDGDLLEEAKKLPGVKIFTPKENRPMNHWYEIPFEHQKYWQKFLLASCDNASLIEKKK